MYKLFVPLLAAMVLSACSPSETLLRDLHERDANEIIAVLANSGIISSKQADAKGKTFAVTVKKEELPSAVQALRAVGLPRENRSNLNEIFKSSGFAPTAFEERVRFIYGTSQELERTISYMPGVLNVRVHVVIPEKVSRREQQHPPSASVFISYDETVAFELQVPKIRKLVSEAIENLDPANVDILTTATKVDLTKIAPAPMTSSDSLPIIMALALLVLGAVGGALWWFRSALATFAQKLKK